MAKTAAQAVSDLRVRKRDIITKWKTDRGCKTCGETHIATLDLHHRDPAMKHPRLRHRVRKKADGGKRTGGYFWRDLSYADLAEELAKCDVLCSNCHRILEWEQRLQKVGTACGPSAPSRATASSSSKRRPSAAWMPAASSSSTPTRSR